MHVIITFKYKKERMKKAEKKWRHCFPIITLSVTMETSGRIWPNFKLNQALVVQEQPRKNRDTFFPLYAYGDFFRRSMTANSAVSCPIPPKFELVRALMHVIVTCKYQKERMKNSREKVETLFFLS